MNKKIQIIILFLVLSLAGCSAKYEVEIKNNKVTEKESFIINKSLVNKKSIYYTVDKIVGKYFPSADFLLGEKTKEFYDKDDAIYQKINELDIDEYNNSNIFGFCFSAHNVIQEDNYIMITTSEKFNCFDYYDELENIDIVLKTNHKLIETNADKIDEYIYTWHIDKNNAHNKRIYVKLYKDKYVFNYNHEFTKNLCIIGGIILLIIVIILIFVKKKRKSNKI